MDDLAEQEEVGVGLAEVGDEPGEEGAGDRVGSVEAPPVDPARRPVGDDPPGPVGDLGLAVVEGGQLAVALEGGVAEAVTVVARGVEPEPPTGW